MLRFRGIWILVVADSGNDADHQLRVLSEQQPMRQRGRLRQQQRRRRKRGGGGDRGRASGLEAWTQQGPERLCSD